MISDHLRLQINLRYIENGKRNNGFFANKTMKGVERSRWHNGIRSRVIGVKGKSSVFVFSQQLYSILLNLILTKKIELDLTENILL